MNGGSGVGLERSEERAAPLPAVSEPAPPLGTPSRGGALRTGGKRAFDIVLASAGLLAALPVMLAIAALIRMERRGPVLFRQRRLGLGGRSFDCLKFRTMHVGAEERLRADPALYGRYVAGGYKLHEDEDPRVTRLGRVLRRAGVDELPQLVNVLRGEMSLVGPRPIVPEEVRHYPDGGAVLLSVRPGVTGAWQAMGREAPAYPERAAIELSYVRTWNLPGDVRILLRTVSILPGRLVSPE